MIVFWFELSVLLAGFAAAVLLFWRIPDLPRAKTNASIKVSVIIPARNEAKTLPLLLADLKAQSFPPHEIIVVNDASEDDTEAVARSFGVRVISPGDKPENWVGKCWACQAGAKAAAGDSFVFLDADVRLSPDGLRRIAGAHAAHGTISVQPWHTTQRCYESCALVFNLVHIGAIGSALPRPVNFGMFGPVIAISRADYAAIGGHETVKTAVVEDMALAGILRGANIPFRVFVGDADVAYRMYPGGFAELWLGFVKNLATGAAKTPVWLFLLVTLFLASLASAALHLAISLFTGHSLVWLYGTCYLLWVAALSVLGRRIGRFHPLAFVFYPAPLSVFLAVFLQSLAIRLFRGKVKWKGRAIELER
ncbi:MAG TPA: glycosyl transferase family 2 [Clostridiales bacterium]|jgi:4,4'-diaponeurosporenoate glycosyltransferase|nr:glycosyl transferase family 2 [Clostridiales bacterium]